MKQYKILLVEDEPQIAQAFTKQLTLLGGFAVQKAENGSKTFEMLESEDIDLVLLDMVLPDMDGLEILQTIRESEKQYANIPILILTNVSSPELQKNAKKHNIQGFLIKTHVVPDELIRKIQDTLKKK